MNEGQASAIASRWAGQELLVSPREDSILVLEPDAVLLAHPEEGVWYVQHVWGPPRRWPALFLALADELIRRGQGKRPVRWRRGGPVARLADRLLRPRAAAEHELVRSEFTAEEALPILERYRGLDPV